HHGKLRTGVLKRDVLGRRTRAVRRGCSVKQMRTDEEFSFIEIILAVAIMGILTVISLSSMQKYSSRRDMLQGARQLAGDLRLTQQFALTQGQNLRLVYAASATSSYTILKS